MNFLRSQNAKWIYKNKWYLYIWAKIFGNWNLKNTRSFKIYQSFEIIENGFNKICKICIVKVKNYWWEKITKQMEKYTKFMN